MLVVLLVLAGVMITLILTTLKPPSSPEKVLSKQEFLSMCENYCNDPEKDVEYCRTYWNGRDWNGNNIPSELIRVGKYSWPACEDRIYCFLVKPCERLGTGIELLRRCRDLLCGTYIDIYESVEVASRKLKSDISFSTRCDLSKVPKEENWYLRVFEGGCFEKEEGISGSVVSLQNCLINVDNEKVECTTSCISPTLLIVTGKNNEGDDVTIYGSPTISDGKARLTDSRLKDIDCDQEINVILQCEKPEGTGIASANCKS